MAYKGDKVGLTDEQFRRRIEKRKKRLADRERERRLEKLFENVKMVSGRKPLVTAVMPVVARPYSAQMAIFALERQMEDIPHVTKIFVHPLLKRLRNWIVEEASKRMWNIQVISEFYFPIVKAKYESVKACHTKYLFMIDCDMYLINKLNPMVEFMESHPDVGVCSTAIVGPDFKHRQSRFGQNISINKDRVMEFRPIKKPTYPYEYCSYVHNGATIFRMKIFNEVNYDLRYKGQGLEHEDLFLQLLHLKHKWKIVSYNTVGVVALAGEKHLNVYVRGRKMRYGKVRRRGVQENIARLKKKWRLKDMVVIK